MGLRLRMKSKTVKIHVCNKPIFQFKLKGIHVQHMRRGFVADRSTKQVAINTNILLVELVTVLRRKKASDRYISVYVKINFVT